MGDGVTKACLPTEEDGGVDGGKDKILTAGPSAWESAETSLVDELRTLLRAKDMALAEQRARHAKGSVVIREQRHALARNEPSFSRKIAKLFGWADAGEQPMSPRQESPMSSRSTSPIGSPTANGGRKNVDIGDVGASGMADVVTDTPNRPVVQGLSTVALFGDGTGRSSSQKYRRRSSPPFAKADPIRSYISNSGNGKCPQCTQLRHELEMAITDRTLAEAEVVSTRRVISSIGTAWECEPSAGKETNQTVRNESEGDAATETAPSSPSEMADKDLNLREELGRLERFASLRDEGGTLSEEPDPQPGDEANNASADLAASLSATVASRARYFEGLSRRRVLRLEVEADLRAARAKLDTLLAGAATARQTTNHASDDNRLETCRNDEHGGRGKVSPQQGSNGEVSRKQAAAKGDNEDASDSNRQKGVGSLKKNAVSPKRGVGFGNPARDGPGRGQGSESRQAENRVGRSRGHAFAPADVPVAPPGNKRRSPVPLGTTTKRRPPHVKVEETPPSCLEGGAETTSRWKLNTPRKKGNAPNPRQQGASAQKERPDKRESSADRVEGPGDTENTAGADGNPKRESSEEVKHNKGGASEVGSYEERATTEDDQAQADKEALSDQGNDKVIGDPATTAGTEAKENAWPSGPGQPRSPPTSPQRPKGVAISAAQLRRPPNSLRGGRTKGDGGRTNGGGASSQTKTAGKREEQKPGNTSLVIHEPHHEDNNGAISDNGHEGSPRGHEELEASNAVDENAPSTSETLRHAQQGDETPDTGEGKKTSTPKKNDRQVKTKRNERQARVAPRQPRGQGTREDIAPKSTGRSPEKTKKAKPALRNTRAGGVRAGSVPEKNPPDREAAAPEAGGARKPGERQAENALGESGAESHACDASTAKRSAGDGTGEVDGRSSRDKVTDGSETAGAGGRQEAPCPGVNPDPFVTSVHDSEKARGRKNEGSDGAFVVVSGQSTVRHDARIDDLLPRRVVDLAEALRADVDRLRLEKAELEDTVAQLNVAAAQLYFVEYDRMKAKCLQLKRVILGPSSKPTEQEATYGHSCQEILYRLKVIGLSFFRRRIGGAMGEKFFPDGLARTLSLLGKKQVAQACQTTTIERLGPLGLGGVSLPSHESRDVQVQVAGGIDAEDEPLMEQQVYSLLGKLDLLLKGREDVLRAYHREAEEGAQEARALLASAKAQHNPGKAWGVPRPPNIRQILGRREGPAGAPRPAINPTNLLFTAAAVLDSTVAAAEEPVSDSFLEPNPAAVEGGHGNGSRRQRFSPAERALLELADEVVAALESEQRRSDASAERRRFLVERRNSRGPGSGDAQALGKPPVGVPPLIWAMEIHLVGKLARAFRTAVEARGFEREVEDANLVAAVSLGRSPLPSTSRCEKSEGGSPCPLGHRIMSVLRGEEGEEDKRRRKGARGDHERGEQQPFDCGVGTYSPPGTSRSKRGAGGADAFQTKLPGTRSPRRAERLSRTEQSGRLQVTTARSSPRGVHHGSTVQPKSTRQGNDISKVAAGTRRNFQQQQHQQQQREQQIQDSGAAARVEAAVFDTVRPSRLHPRPGSASVEGRGGRDGYEGYRASAAATNRPQSARLAEPRRAYEGAARQAPGTTVRWQQPVRPSTATTPGPASAAARRPASASGRVVDTRIWSSHKTTPSKSGAVFRCLPNSTAGTVRFEGDGAVPTHSREVPEFLRWKERELIERDREKRAAVNGRFTVVSDDDETNGAGADVSDLERVEYRYFGRSRVESNEQRREVWGGERGSEALSSLRLEDSMDGAGLLPDAGEQAFFDAWKPTGYDIDLSRYD